MRSITIKQLLLIVCVYTVLFLDTSCTPSEYAIQTAIAETAAAYTLTPTLEPSITPTVTFTSTPMYAIFTAQQVINAFVSAGLEVGNYEIMDSPDDFGASPYVAIGAIHFYIPSLCPDCGGRVQVFDDPVDLELVRHYYISLGESSAMLFSWVFVNGNALVQINGDLPEDQARQYETALLSLFL